jgi:HK97 family phage major capsid protein
METTDRAAVEEAKKIIDGIVSHQKNTDDRMTQFDRQVDDIKKAQRLLRESIQTAPTAPVGGDARLKTFVEETGAVRWTAKTKAVQVHGKGTINSEYQGLLDADVPVNDWHEDLQKIAAKRAFARLIMSNPHTPKSDLALYRHLQSAPRSLQPAITKAFSDTASSGAEWIPDEFIPSLYKTFEIPRGLRALLRTVEVDRATVLIPKMTRGGRPYIKGKVTSDNPANYEASTVSTAQSSVTIGGLACRMVIDDAAAEDSAIAALPTLSAQIAQDLEDAFEDAMINGDTATPHEDAIESWDIRGRWGSTGLGGTSDHRRYMMGFRAEAKDRSSTVDGGAGTFAYSDIVSAMSQMGELAVQDRILVCSPEMMIKYLLPLSEVLTIQNYGDRATIISGSLASISGMPIVMSRFMGADMNGNGLFDNATKTQTGFVIFNTGSYIQYLRRGILIETQKDIASGSIDLVATMRSKMHTPDAASTKNVVYSYDWTA